jgi:hypothetical protein
MAEDPTADGHEFVKQVIAAIIRRNIPSQPGGKND